MQVAPVHASAVHGLSMRFPFYAPAVRLCARWVHAHLFSDVLAHEAIELIVASLFVTPAPFAVPTSALAAFVRFLHLLATFPWQDEPMVVDLDDAMTPAQRQAAQAAFKQLRATAGGAADEGRALVLPTAYDASGTVWTARQPTVLMRARLVRYAKAALDTLQARSLDPSFVPAVLRDGNLA